MKDSRSFTLEQMWINDLNAVFISAWALTQTWTCIYCRSTEIQGWRVAEQILKVLSHRRQRPDLICDLRRWWHLRERIAETKLQPSGEQSAWKGYYAAALLKCNQPGWSGANRRAGCDLCQPCWSLCCESLARHSSAGRKGDGLDCFHSII